MFFSHPTLVKAQKSVMRQASTSKTRQHSNAQYKNHYNILETKFLCTESLIQFQRNLLWDWLLFFFFRSFFSLSAQDRSPAKARINHIWTVSLSIVSASESIFFGFSLLYPLFLSLSFLICSEAMCPQFPWPQYLEAMQDDE